jgi:hypothetical protein
VLRGRKSGFASVGMTKERAVYPLRSAADEVTANLSFVIPTEAKRSGGTCGFSDLPEQLFRFA